MSGSELIGWDRLRHGGLLLDASRLRKIAAHAPGPLSSWQEKELRRQAGALLDGSADRAGFVRFVLEEICGFTAATGSWQRGPQVGAEWGRRVITGETAKPRQLWRTSSGAMLPVFLDDETRLGIGRGRRSISQMIQWLRGGSERLAVLTNGRQWRLIFAGLDFDAWCEWDAELWFEEGALSAQVTALRTLLSPVLWTPSGKDALFPLLEAILDSRKGQAELSAVLGERVREAVEILVQSHGDVLKEQNAPIHPAEIYRAAVRMVMRIVVVLFAESRDLLPRDNALYHGAYGITGLLEDLEKVAARGGNRLARSWNAWPRVLALFRLVYSGSHHEKLPVPAYGGDLFAPGDDASPDGLTRALAVFENACFDREILSDRDVNRLLEHLTRTRVKLRQGRTSIWVPAPVDFSDLSSEYIGILYEGLLDFELKTAPPGDPVIFLSVGNQPALPLSRLEAMDDRALADLLEKMKDTGREEGESEEGVEGASADGNEEPDHPDEDENATGDEDILVGESLSTAEEEIADSGDERHTTRTRAEMWARRAVSVGNLVRRPRGSQTPERQRAYEETIARKARQLVARVILPGEWYLVRWGGTRKGAGTFYTRPGLAVPTVQRTLRPLAYDPPVNANGQADFDAPPAAWTPKLPEAILALKVCDIGCGSGSFPVASLRFLTDALYAALLYHGRITVDGEKAIARLLVTPVGGNAVSEERLVEELLPCRPDDDDFEIRTRAILRRHIVERCLYGVDIDPLAVELCRLSLWIETMDRTLPFSFLDHKIKCGNSLVGGWLDTFCHYPVMAWKNREGGDKGHTNGVHFEKEARSKALKAFVKDRLTPDLRHFLDAPTLAFSEARKIEAASVHAEVLSVLARLHKLPVYDSAERSRIYREEILGSPGWRSLKAALDLWCACWFWPADALDDAPLPSTLADPPPATRDIAARVAAEKHFFHWEIEFPDVFSGQGSGFDALVGNPPWETLQPNSMEFFSNIDPLYRAYGKQDALRHQTHYFADAGIERAWLDYNTGFANDSNWMKHAASPFGDPDENEASGNRFTIARGRDNQLLHARWRDARRKGRGFADPAHPFRHRGEGKAYTYKLFLEQAHALLRDGGRLGFIVPSGLYSDHGTGGLRRLFLDHCRWEWLFGFENRERIFEIHRSFKFNPVIIRKGGTTAAIRTAFMRRKLEDWENAEAFVTSYSREQVARFSPWSLAILEIQSQRDLEILEKIYTNSVLLGDDSPDGWGIKYAQGDFNMTSDSRLFPPRPRWETDGFRPDEYSRWLKGNWRPIEELWAELGVDPTKPRPMEIEIEDWLFDTNVGPEERVACARQVHGHLLKPGDVQRTPWRLRCAQPPYDSLPIPRADIPQGIILSREADAWIREDRIEDTALPLYEGRMIGQFDFSQKGWVSGKGRTAVWRDIPWDRKQIEPQFLMTSSVLNEEMLERHLNEIEYLKGKDAAKAERIRLSIPDQLSEWQLAMRDRMGYMAVGSATNMRSMIASQTSGAPHGNAVPVLRSTRYRYLTPSLTAILDSLAFDFAFRLRLAGLNLNYFIVAEAPVTKPDQLISQKIFRSKSFSLTCCAIPFSHLWQRTCGNENWRVLWSLTTAERLQTLLHIEVAASAISCLDLRDMEHILADCDHPCEAMNDLGLAAHFNPSGFWRVDKDKDPELRHTVLTLIAFHDLEEKIRACGGDREKGIEAFLNQNDGEGWLLPETLCLADYGLGHDERAKHPQSIAGRLGPRFYDWQLAQSPEESWRECHRHARNLLGEAGYQQLLTDIESPKEGEKAPQVSEPAASYNQSKGKQGKLFE